MSIDFKAGMHTWRNALSRFHPEKCLKFLILCSIANVSESCVIYVRMDLKTHVSLTVHLISHLNNNKVKLGELISYDYISVCLITKFPNCLKLPKNLLKLKSFSTLGKSNFREQNDYITMKETTNRSTSPLP